MKTIKIAVIAMMGISLGVHAQITDTGGNVGIGTKNPSEKLDVEGNLKITGDLKMSGSDSYIWTNGTGTGYTGIWDQKNRRVLFYTSEKNGYVGIGTKNPSEKLDVEGNLKITGDLKMSGSDSYIWTNGTGTGYTGIYDQKNRRVLFYTSEKNGYVGIGTNIPASKLHVKENRASIFIENTAPNNWSFLRIKGSGNKLWDIAQYGDTDNLEFRPNGSGTNRIVFNQNGKIGLGNLSPSFNLDVSSARANIRLRNTNPSNWAFLRIQGSGNRHWDIAQYGDNDFLEFRPNGSTATVIFKQNGNTAIKGKLEAKEIKVTTSPTADFVFEENYDLPTLKSIEKHIKEKKHLPEIASAKEMEKNGVNIGNFQIQLLQKIEELTLYTIEQDKKLNIQQKEIEELKKQNSRIKDLEKLVQKLLKDKN